MGVVKEGVELPFWLRGNRVNIPYYF